MNILKTNQFNPEWLKQRLFVCYLPTEMVIPNRYSESLTIPPLDSVYAYKLPTKEFPVKVVKTPTSHCWNQQVAIEIHEDWGSDGHTNYTFSQKFVIVYDNEIPKTFKEYEILKKAVYDYEDKLIRDDPQLELNFSWF
jgi:hypothetical protein